LGEAIELKRRDALPAVVLAVLLAGCLVAVYVTRDSGRPQPAPAITTASGQADAVALQLLETANRMAALAESSDERSHAQEAQRLADHELDQAFATALRLAAAYRPPTTGPLPEIIARINQLKTRMAAERDKIAQLTKSKAENAEDQLDLVNAEMALDQDDLDDAQQELARNGGDPHAALEQALKNHDAIEHLVAAQGVKSLNPGPTGTFVEQVRSWFALGSRDQQLLAAKHQAADQAKDLSARRQQRDQQLKSGRSDDGAVNTADKVANLRRLSDLRKTLTEMDERIQDCQQLAGVYGAWSAQIEMRRRGVWHLMLESIAEILAILLAAFIANLGIRRLFHQTDRKRLHQARVIAAVAVQLVAVLLILLVLFGPPNQLSTIIGLATAGLTVVLKDFIVAFFGWFTLMGKNGIRAGDWVEINGVSGEVIEIGLLKTVLLELGNWTDTGHPTGRQVAFSNSFAMEGHYFNFSTAGQWLWDELTVTIPAAGEPYRMAEEIRTLVERETDADSAQAAQDWERVTSQYGARTFSARPAVNLRPGVNGLEVAVRYITRAPERNAMKSKLFQAIVDLLHKSAGKQPATV
jgi:small-conductance mechanosensitive channel